MISAVDSNVLVDLFESDPEFGMPSRECLRTCAAEGPLVICEVVCAEIAGYYSSPAAQRAFDDMNISFSPLTIEAALQAGAVWKAYRSQGGPRTRVAADFLIGAHALVQADRLLTRDSRFFRNYFKHLRVLDPTHR